MTKKIFTALLLIFSIFFPTAALAADLPFKTWESGKQHSIVISGPGATDKWRVTLTGENIDPILFKVSVKGVKGVFVHSIDIPRDFPTGGYILTLNKPNRKDVQVAAIQIKARETYRITEIPTDLRLLTLIFAGLTAIFTVVRGRKYAFLNFQRRKVEKPNFLYRFRNDRLASEGNSLAKYVILYSGENLHRLSPIVWAFLPWLAIPLGVFTALRIQFEAAIPNGPIYLFFICAVIGALDATVGIALALSFGFMHVALGNVTNVRSMVVAVTFTLLWYFPAIVSALINLVAPFDFKRLQKSQAQLVSALLGALVGGASTVVFTILTDSLVINRQSSELLRWPLAGAVALALLIKQLILQVNKNENVEEEKLYMARVVSPGLAATVFFGTLLLVYVWTNQFASALIGALVIAAPYFALFVVFPKLGKLARGDGKRNLLLESIIVIGLTYGVYLGIQSLPVAVISKSRAFILIGLVPSFIHALYSVVMASREFESRRAEMEEMS